MKLFNDAWTRSTGILYVVYSLYGQILELFNYMFIRKSQTIYFDLI